VTKTLLFLGLRGNEAPDLVFGQVDTEKLQRTSPPVLAAFDKKTGQTVHSVQLDVAPTGTPMTYMAGGKQYIVMAYGIASQTGLIGLTLE
jgi:quinoprotein glucose dehydrogenase